MSTVLQVIEAAYRRSGVQAAGVAINSTQRDAALELLQGAYVDLIAKGTLGRLTDVLLTDNSAYEAKEFERVVNPDGATITYPESVLDEGTGSDRPPTDLAIIEVVTPGNDPVFVVYDASRGEWQELTGLATGDHAPLSSRYDDGLKYHLAHRICDDVGIPASAVVIRMSSVFRLALASRYNSPRRATQPTEFY